MRCVLIKADAALLTSKLRCSVEVARGINLPLRLFTLGNLADFPHESLLKRLKPLLGHVVHVGLRVVWHSRRLRTPLILLHSLGRNRKISRGGSVRRNIHLGPLNHRPTGHLSAAYFALLRRFVQSLECFLVQRFFAAQVLVVLAALPSFVILLQLISH